ncbi:MAG: hypothetical protein QME81_13340 [bacterium]|nr:hypothetical protein [bacterium]
MRVSAVKIESGEMEKLTRIALIFPVAAFLIICFLGGCGKKDKNPAAISLVAGFYDLEVSSGPRGAAISWKTDIAAASEIEYGPSSNNYSYQARDEGPVGFEHGLEIRA